MRKIKPGLSLIAALLVAVMVLSSVPLQADAASSSEIKKQINVLKKEKEELQAQINAIRGQYEANEDELLAMVDEKNIIDQEITLLYEQISNINDQIMSYSLLIADLQDELDAAEAHLTELNEKYKERIRAMEEEGEVSYWEVLFKSNSFSDLLDRLNMIQEIAASDQRRMQELTEAAEAVSAAQENLSQEKGDLEATRTELNDAELLLEEKRAEADEILAELIAKGEEFEILLEESENAQEELMQEIAKKEKEYDKAKHQEWLATSVVTQPTQPGGSVVPSTQVPSSGGWVSPVAKGSYRITSPFGMRVHPILGYARMHNGVDMAAPKGTPVYAAKSGKVTVAGWGSQAGNYVSINHGDGFASIYMHLTHYIVSAGTYVNAGQVIGYVGSTGLSTGPHLHFGISYNGTYVNPMNYI